MKTKILSFITLVSIIICSCSSDSNEGNTGNDYFIKAKVNGQSIKLTHLAQALQLGTANNMAIMLYAGNSPARIYPFFSFDIDNLTQITTGTYSDATHDVLFQFHDSNEKGYINDNTNNLNDFQVNITEVSDSYVKGTFVGVLWEEINLTENITVTEGEFYLPRYYNEFGNTNPSN